jgi:hypothetical protein
MYHAYSKQGLGVSISLDPSDFAKAIVGNVVEGMKPKIPGLVKIATDAAIKEIKPRIPELVEAAMPSLKAQIPGLITAAEKPLKAQIPNFLAAAEKPLEEYLTKRRYPKVIRPLAEKELSKLGGQAKTKVSAAALGGGSLLLVGVVAFLAFRKSQRKAQ